MKVMVLRQQKDIIMFKESDLKGTRGGRLKKKHVEL